MLSFRRLYNFITTQMANTNFALRKNCLTCSPPLFLPVIILSFCCLPFSLAKVSYADHCGAIVPQVPSSSFALDSTIFISFSGAYFSGRDKIFADSAISGSFGFYATHVYRTQQPEIFYLTGSLSFEWRVNGTSGVTFRRALRRIYSSVSQQFANFKMAGFWSNTTGKICMVGTGSTWFKGTSLNLNAVFNLNFPSTSNIHSSIISGSVRSTAASHSPNHFDTMSVLVYSPYNYIYTQLPRLRGMCSQVQVPKQVSGFETSSASSYLPQLLHGQYRLRYGGDCSDANCGPFPTFTSLNLNLNQVQSNEDGKVNGRILFSNSSTHSGFNYYMSDLIPGRSLVTEGYWDSERRVLCLLACPVSKEEDSSTHSYVGECTVGLTLWFPSVFTIKEGSRVVGRIWSIKGKNDPGYFGPISFRSVEGHNGVLHGIRYRYTVADTLRRTCETTKTNKLGGAKYPDENSVEDLKFDISLSDGSRGDATPMSFGDDFYGENSYGSVFLPISSGVSLSGKNKRTNQTLWDVSYMINYIRYNYSSGMQSITDIIAEGVYNAETGKLCMVGCKEQSLFQAFKNGKADDPEDCQIQINIQLSPLNQHNSAQTNSTRHVNGTIRSTRKKSDPLYFEPLEISSTAMYVTEARETVVRMDMEIAMVVISLTLSCVFVVFQIFHVRRHQDVLPSLSITMLAVLTVGYMVSLVLNFEGLFLMNRGRNSVMLWSGGWLQAKEITVRVLTMLAFLLQCRLLQLALVSRSSNQGSKGLWVAERKALKFCLPLYFAGALIAWFVHAKPYKASPDRNRFVWDDVICYLGLILDGFLLPQIILNITSSCKDRVLAPFFYVGTTGVRVLPHLYDFYRARNYVSYFKFSYIYASPDGDYYSTAWDIFIPLVAVLFAVLLYLQQQFGGSCFLPQRFRKPEAYEMVPVISF